MNGLFDFEAEQSKGKYGIFGEWLVYDGGCSCRSNLFPHDPYCGLEPVVRLSEISGLRAYIEDQARGEKDSY